MLYIHPPPQAVWRPRRPDCLLHVVGLLAKANICFTSERKIFRPKVDSKRRRRQAGRIGVGRCLQHPVKKNLFWGSLLLTASRLLFAVSSARLQLAPALGRRRRLLPFVAASIGRILFCVLMFAQFPFQSLIEGCGNQWEDFFLNLPAATILAPLRDRSCFFLPPLRCFV